MYFNVNLVYVHTTLLLGTVRNKSLACIIIKMLTMDNFSMTADQKH